MTNVVKLLVGFLFCFVFVFGVFKVQQSHKFRDITTTEFSNVMIEPAVVVETVFTPSIHQSNIDIGLTTNLDLSFTPRSINVPEKYAVVFQCDHGKFIIERKELWDKLKVGDKVVVSYREVYNVLSTDKDRDGVRESSVSLVDYDFVSAKKR